MTKKFEEGVGGGTICSFPARCELTQSKLWRIEWNQPITMEQTKLSMSRVTQWNKLVDFMDPCVFYEGVWVSTFKSCDNGIYPRRSQLKWIINVQWSLGPYWPPPLWCPIIFWCIVMIKKKKGGGGGEWSSPVSQTRCDSVQVWMDGWTHLWPLSLPTAFQPLPLTCSRSG